MRDKAERAGHACMNLHVRPTYIRQPGMTMYIIDVNIQIREDGNVRFDHFFHVAEKKDPAESAPVEAVHIPDSELYILHIGERRRDKIFHFRGKSQLFNKNQR